MEILIGRVTADAKVSTLKDEKQVVNFSIAINNSYKPKGSMEAKQLTTYANCSYWISTGIASHLKKGVLVELCGRISVSAWNNMKGEAQGSLNFHVSNIKLHGKAKTAAPDTATPTEPQAANAGDDLPF